MNSDQFNSAAKESDQINSSAGNQFQPPSNPASNLYIPPMPSGLPTGSNLMQPSAIAELSHS